MDLRHLDRPRPRTGQATPRRAPGRRLALAAGTACIVGGLALAWTSPASAASATVSVSPNSGLVAGNSAAVTVVTPNATPSNVFVAVTQCGNATSSGTPLSALAADGSDCVGASGLGTSLQVIGTGGAASPVGPVAAGTYHVTLKLVESGLGTANAKCIAMPPATLPCSVVASTGTLSGVYSGSGSFNGSAPLTYANNASTTTTTKATTTTTRASTTSTTSGTNQSISASVGSTTTTRVALAAGSGTPSSGASSSGAAPSNSALAATGPSRFTWILGLVALGLLDLGYLALSATWRRRRWASSSSDGRS